MKPSKSKSSPHDSTRQLSVLFLALAILAGSPSPLPAASGSSSWNGRYLQENGAQDLYLEQYDNLLSVDIVRAGQPKNSPAESSHFVARIKGNVAIFDDHEGCKTRLIRKPEGVEIQDHCGAAERDSGRYKKVS